MRHPSETLSSVQQKYMQSKAHLVRECVESVLL